MKQKLTVAHHDAVSWVATRPENADSRIFLKEVLSLVSKTIRAENIAHNAQG